MADYPEITQTRAKRPFLNALSKGLAAFDRYVRDPNNILAQALPLPENADRVGLTAGLSSLLGIPEAASLLEKLAYGDRLTTGAGQTLKPADDVVEGALTVAPVLTSGLAGAGKVLKKIPAPKQGQTNALLGGLAGDDPNLWLSHGSHDHELINSKGELIRELYNPSFAITRDKLSTFKGANAVIVPWPEKLDPKNAKTLLTATDSYNPRWHASKAARFDNLPWDIDLGKGLADSRTAEFVNQRLFEKLGSPFPKQGIKQEGRKDAPKGALPRLMQGLAGVTNRFSPVENSNDWFSHRILMSPRFQSLESFAQSPYGGQLIGELSGQSRLERVRSQADALMSRLRVIDATGRPSILRGGDSPYQKESVPNLIKGLASNVHPAELLARRKRKDLTFLDELVILDKADPRGYRYLTPDEQVEIQKYAGGLLKQAKTAPSDYAELKAYGPWQMSADNVAGIVGRSGISDDILYKQAKARGIPYEPADNTKEEVEAAAWMLSRKKGDTPPLTRGLAKAPPVEPLENYFAALPDLTSGSGIFKHDWLDNQLGSLHQNWVNGNFDYLPESVYPLVKKVAQGTGDTQLLEALEAYYKHPDFLKAGIPPDHITGHLLDKLDMFAPKAAINPALEQELLATGAATATPSKIFDFSNKSLAELKAMDVSGATKGQLAEYDAALEAATIKENSMSLKSMFESAPQQKQIAAMNFEEFSKVDIDSLNEKQLKAYIEAANTFNQFNYFKSPTDYLWAIGKAEFNLENLSKKAGKTIDLDADLAKMPPANNPFNLSSGLAKSSPVKDFGMEDLIGMASGDIPWAGEATFSSWPMEHHFMKLNSKLTSDQAKKLEDIAFWVQLKKKNATTSLAQAWDDDIDGAIKALLEK